MTVTISGGSRQVGEWLVLESRNRSFSVSDDQDGVLSGLVVFDNDNADPVKFALERSGNPEVYAVVIVVSMDRLEPVLRAIEFTPGIGRHVMVTGRSHGEFVSTFQLAWDRAQEAMAFFKGEALVSAHDQMHVRRVDNLVAQKHLLFDLLLESMPDTIYFKDRESRFLVFNSAMVRKFGRRDASEIRGRTDFDIFGSEHASEAFEDEQSLIRGEVPIIRKVEREDWPDGHITWSQTTKLPIKTRDGDILGTFGISRDITKEREMEVNLQRERNLIGTLINLLPARIYVKDASLKYIFNNLEHLRFLGLEEQEQARGRSIAEFFPADAIEALVHGEQRLIREGKPVLNRVEYSEEESRWMLVNKVPLRDASGDIAGIVGLSVDITHQKQLEEKMKARNRQMESELALARALQQTFLPQSYPVIRDRLSHRVRLEFAHLYLPSFTLGGDFLHVHAIDSHRVAVMLCDVMGHGVRASLVTAMLRAMTSELAPLAGKPAKFLTQINRLLRDSLGGGPQLIFVTGFYGVIDADAGTIDYVHAGSNCVILVSGSDRRVAKLDSKVNCGPALGLFPDHVFEQNSRKIEPCDEIICYTDGVIEASRRKDEGSEEREAFGQERLNAFFEHHLEIPTRRRLDLLIDEVEQFTGDRTFDDDICLLAMRLLP